MEMVMDPSTGEMVTTPRMAGHDLRPDRAIGEC